MNRFSGWMVGICCAVVLGCFAIPEMVWAVEDADCFQCHGEADIKNDAGRSLYVDAKVFAASVHKDNGCVSCHADITEVPHNPKLKTVNCGECHAEQEEYAKSLHGLALAKGDKDVASCDDCHGKHDIRAAKDPLSSMSPVNQPATCGKCHSNPELVARHMISVQHPSDAYMQSTHAKAILAGNLKAASCSSCHGTHSMHSSQDTDSSVNRMNLPKTCGVCHPAVVEEYAKSIHGKALAEGIPDAPTCYDCHGEHDIEASENTGSSVSRENVSRSTCPRCHDDERVMKRYGIETMRSASYMDSYHGMASAAGSKVVASCTSCHGVHSILPSRDSASSTNMANLVKTCGKCHENANENFTTGQVHVLPSDPKQKALGIVRLIYIVLIVLTIGGMTFHNSLIMGRHMLGKFFQELRGKDTYKRFSLGQTMGHMVLTVSFITLTITGFALRYPDTWWAQAIFVGDYGLAMRGVIHRAAAIALVALSLVNGIYLVFTKSGREEFRALMMWPKDFFDVLRNMLYVVGLSKTQPRFGRYSYVEKFEYWGMWWGTFVMVVTGFCMWFVNIFLKFLPKIVLDIMALIHFYEAWLAMLTIVVWHLYYMIFDPHTYPMNWSWITGRITEEDFKARHPLEFERVTGKDAGDDPHHGA